MREIIIINLFVEMEGRNKVKLFIKLVLISLVAGSILAVFLKIIQLTLKKQSYVLLFNMDYIPFLKNFDTVKGSGYLFHFVFCFVSVIGLFYVAKMVGLEYNLTVYVLVFTVGSGILYFLTALTNKPPDVTSLGSWLFWTVGHVLFGIVVGMMIKHWTFQQS